jgi:hypothetical protein
MKYLILLFCLIFVGCSTQTPEEKAAALVKEEAEAAVLEEAAAKIAARPHRLEIVSQELDVGRWAYAKVVRDNETGQEFLVVIENSAKAVAVTPIKKDEAR